MLVEMSCEGVLCSRRRGRNFIQGWFKFCSSISMSWPVQQSYGFLHRCQEKLVVKFVVDTWKCRENALYTRLQEGHMHLPKPRADRTMRGDWSTTYYHILWPSHLVQWHERRNMTGTERHKKIAKENFCLGAFEPSAAEVVACCLKRISLWRMACRKGRELRLAKKVCLQPSQAWGLGLRPSP